MSSRIFARRLVPIKKSLFIILCALIFVPLTAAAQLKEEATVEGITIRYVIPDEAKAERVGEDTVHTYPVIIQIGHPNRQDDVEHQWSQLKFISDHLDEPVIAVRSGVLDDNWDGKYVDNWPKWRKNSKEFLKVIDFVKAKLPCDEDRIYLTGLSFDGVYAWMLAYDIPELYAGVVALSAVSYPQQIQRKLKSGKKVVTIVIRGEKDHMFPKRLSQERRTGKKLQNYNKYSRWILFEGYGHDGGLMAFWIPAIEYIMQFKRRNEIVEKYKDSFRSISEVFTSAEDS